MVINTTVIPQQAAVDGTTILNTGGTLSLNKDDDTVKVIATKVRAVQTPIGGVISWLKSYLNTPQTLPFGWVECNGQTLNDPNSVYNGQVIPNLNGATGGTQRFLRGSITSGTLGGSETHSHTVPATNASVWGQTGAGQAGQLVTNATGPAWATTNASTSSTATLPSYYETVLIMRVK